MTIDEAMQIILRKLDNILIPGSESGKMEAVKNDVREVAKFARNEAAKRAAQEAKKEEESHVDDHDE